jgi:hypothetical protein
MKRFTLISVALLAMATTAQAQVSLQNIQTSAALDVTAPMDFEHSEDNKLDIRSAELLFFGPLDPTFDATINLAAHNEDGEYKAELHEAYLASSKLIPSSRFRVGKFFLGVGRLNQFHQHDWPFISAPKVQSQFFADEGVADSGGEFSTLLPLDSYWDITVGVTNGYTWGESEDPARKPQVPTHYIHPVNFIDFGDSGALQWGMNYLGRTDADGIQTQLYGLDFTFKKTEGKTLDRLFQSEIWMRVQNGPEMERTEEVGAYFYPQYALSERTFAGVRFDVFSELSRKFEDGEKQDNLEYAIVPTLTFKNSEFALFRAAYTYGMQTAKDQPDTVDQKIELQFVAILGAHPAHSF